MDKNLKVLNIKVEEELLKKLNHYRTYKKVSQAKFTEEAINEKCNNEKLLRSGGMILKVPNPNFYNLSEEQGVKIMLALINCINELNNITPYTDMEISEILSHLKTRLLKDDETKRNIIKRNTNEDIEFEEELTYEQREY